MPSDGHDHRHLGLREDMVRGSLRPLFVSSTLSHLCHFATVFQSMPRFRFPVHATLAFAVLLPRRHAWSWRCQDEPVQGCSSHTRIWITPSNRGIKRPGVTPHLNKPLTSASNLLKKLSESKMSTVDTSHPFTSTTTRPCTSPFRIAAPRAGRSASTAGRTIASSFPIGRSVMIRPQARTRRS